MRPRYLVRTTPNGRLVVETDFGTVTVDRDRLAQQGATVEDLPRLIERLDEVWRQGAVVDGGDLLELVDGAPARRGG